MEDRLTGSAGAPMRIWEEWLNGSRKEPIGESSQGP